MQKVSIKLSAAQSPTAVNPYLFGSFVEHMGRCVYGGVYDPENSLSDNEGFRKDVIALTKELGVTLIRYPGGNFVSGYRWEDGVGDKSSRPTRLDLAWRSIETNEFGLNEFMSWAGKAGVEPMMAVNLGTRGVSDAADLVEYTNFPEGTALSELRKSHGVEQPHAIRMWCLGNELDGPWQLGHKSAEDYGKLARETAKAIRLVDPDLRLVACGSSFEEMPTFGEWESTVLEQTFDHVDMISMHAYYEKYGDDTLSFLASSARMDRFIEAVIARADEVAKKKGSDKKINISFDEWNVWYQKRFEGVESLTFQKEPRLIEDEYTQEDAVVVGSLLMSLLKHSERVEVACMAQLVNVIGPIRTEPGAPAWRQTTFYPFSLTSANSKGTLLDLSVSCRSQDSELFEDLKMADAVAILNTEGTQITLFLLSRELQEQAEVQIDTSGLGSLSLLQALYLGGSELNQTNNVENPDRVQPKPLENLLMGENRISITLPPISWAMVRFKIND
jgi:alpha-N-arabinofuranosidase